MGIIELDSIAVSLFTNRETAMLSTLNNIMLQKDSQFVLETEILYLDFAPLISPIVIVKDNAWLSHALQGPLDNHLWQIC